MHSRPRRIFLLQAAAGGAAAALHGAAAAAEVSPEPVRETDAYPKSMGFRLNTADVDQAKFPRHEPSQKCSECQLFGGKAGDPLGPCSFFKRQVPPDGWCRNFKPRKKTA